MKYGRCFRASISAPTIRQVTHPPPMTRPPQTPRRATRPPLTIPRRATRSRDRRHESRAAYEARKARQEADDLRKQLDHYKAQEETARKAKLTEEERKREEFDLLRDKAERLERENHLVKIATKYKIREEHWGRIIGATPEDLDADAERLSKIPGMTTAPARAGSPTDPARDTGQKGRIYTRKELQADPTLAASAEVRQAAAEGRVK